MKRLILNADDYGRALSVSAGIRQAHREGIVTSTTAMMNMDGILDDLRAAQAECPALGLGVHLTLTAEAPVLNPERVPSLLALAGGPCFPTVAALAAGVASVNPDEVRAEWRAQIEKFVGLTGRNPTHLDSHHHSSYFSPAWFAGMLALAREFECAIRLPWPRQPPAAGMAGGSQAALMARLQQFAPAALAAAPVPHPDNFEIGFYAEGATQASLLDLLRHLPEGTTEIMCHPGLPDDGLPALTSYTTARARELEILTDPDVRRAVAENGVKLVSFAVFN